MLQPGATIGGYRIDTLIGRGAMGEVYRAMQLSLKRPVAIKRIAAHLLQEPQAVARFEREAQCIARVQSPHVVAVHDFGRHADSTGELHWLLVMELVDGGTSLGRILAARSGRLDWRSASSIALQIAEGLAAASEFSVVHRDIKPDNILINRRGIAKLTDFGLAKASDSSAMTAAGALLGTPLYMPPEACRGAEVDARGDLYSLGCTWFQCLAGQPPFRAANSVALLRAHCEEAAPDVRQFASETPAAIAELLARLLAKRADQRPASARELVAQLDVLGLPRSVPELFGSDSQPATAITQVADQGTAATVVPATTTVTLAGTPRRRAPLVIAALAVAAAILVAFTAMALRRENPRRSVDEALAMGDPGLALQRAEALLAARPSDDAVAVAAVRDSIEAEMTRLCGEARFDAARQRLADHRSRHIWLDTGAWERSVAISEARWLVEHDRDDQAVARLVELRTAAPDDLELCRTVLEILGEKLSHRDVAINAAYTLARLGSGPLEPQAITALTTYLKHLGPYGESAIELRKTLLRRHPDITATVRPWLDAEDCEQRGNAAMLLAEAGALSDGEALRHHLRNLVELPANYTASSESLAWMTAEAAKPEWPTRMAAAQLPPFSKVQALMSWNDHSDALITLLATAFREQIEQPAVAWTTHEDEHLRWNGFLILERAGLLERIDVRAFHATTLATFHPLYESKPFTSALAWCAAASGTAQAAVARELLDAGVKNVETVIASYEKADMGSRARTCRERLEQINRTRAAMIIP